MKVSLDKINNKALELSEDISASDWDMDSGDVKFVDKIHVASSFKRDLGEILVDSKITTQRSIVCSRCLSTANHVTEQNFKKNYSLSSLGRDLNIDPDLREEVLLNFPMKNLCKPDCKGICPNCGVNLNIENCQCSKND
tara:strand:- start:1261 stop:1677 length:417 start_codon:yes stop_codon:yes gene_type:complete